jgi:hypothetical protein
MHLQSTSSSTNFDIYALELPVNMGLQAHALGFIPIGVDLGAFVSVPLKYRGAVYRYQQPDYIYGNEKYEKPYAIIGLRGGMSSAFDLLQRFRVYGFIHFDFGLIPIVPAAPDDIEPEFGALVYNSWEFGLGFVLWNKAD